MLRNLRLRPARSLRGIPVWWVDGERETLKHSQHLPLNRFAHCLTHPCSSSPPPLPSPPSPFADHRNASAREWAAAQVVAAFVNASVNGAGVPSCRGLFIDDFWCSNLVNGTGACTDPVQGPTEIDAHNQADMGLSDKDVSDITQGWLQTLTQAQSNLLAAGAYTWNLIPGQDNANAMPLIVGPDAKSCKAYLDSACRAGADWQTVPLMHGAHPGNSTSPFPYMDQDMASFLLMRGPYAWTGYGEWGMTWDTTLRLPGGLLRPHQFDAPYGSPQPSGSTCAPVPGQSGVYTRSLTNVTVTLDCNAWEATYKWATPELQQSWDEAQALGLGRAYREPEDAAFHAQMHAAADAAGFVGESRGRYRFLKRYKAAHGRW